jgi:hypothetical protein
MEDPARYCEYCGKPLNEKARFCGRCGKALDLGEGERGYPPGQVPPVRSAEPMPGVKPAQAPPPRPSQPLPTPAPHPVQERQPPAPPPPRPGQPLPQPVNQAAVPPEVVCGVIPGAYQKKSAFSLSQQGFVLVLTNYRVIFAMQTSQMMGEHVSFARDAAKQEGKGFFGQWGAQLSASTKYYQQKQPQATLAEQPGNFFILNNQVRQVKFHVIPGGEEGQDEYRLDFESVTGKISVMFGMIDQKKAREALTQVLGERVKWSRGLFG